MRSLLLSRYESAKEKLKQQLEEAESCAITTDFWRSSSAQSYITVTCHFIDKLWELHSFVLCTYQVTMSHTAENIAAELKNVASDWNIAHKIYCLVTDNASNMVAAAKLTGWRHIPCFAHTLNSIVQEATDKDPELSQLRQKCQNIVTFLSRV